MEFTLRLAEVLFDGRLVRLQFSAPVAPEVESAPDWRPAALENLHATANGIPLEPLGSMCVDWSILAENEWEEPADKATLEGSFLARVEYVDRDGKQAELSSIYATLDSGKSAKELLPGSVWNLRLPYPVPTGQTARVYLTNPQANSNSFQRIAEGLPPGTQVYSIQSSRTVANGPPPQPLTSWVLHALVPEGQILTQGQSVKIDVPPTLLRTSTSSTAPASQTAVNRSLVGPDGFSSAALGQNRLTVHVSASHGDDKAPGTPTRPVRSVGMAFQLLQKAPSAPATIRLLRGDRFFEDIWRPHWKNDQFDLLVIEDYWDDTFGADPQTRPIVVGKQKNSPISWHGGHAPQIGPILIRRIHWSECRVVPVNGGRAWIFDDCLFERAPIGLQAVGQYSLSEVVFLRCILIDAADDRDRIQALFCHHGRRVLISQCVVDRCGYIRRDFSRRNVFSHNLYMQTSIGEVAIWGSWVMRGGSHGIQLRSNGLISRCVFNRNALGTLLGRSGTQSQNLILHSDDIGPKLLRGWGAGLGNDVTPGYSQRLEGCLILNSLGGSARAIDLGDEGNTSEPPRIVKEIRHNLVLNHGRVIQIGGIGRRCLIHSNVFNAIPSDTVYAFKPMDNATFANLSVDLNVYSIPERSTFLTSAPVPSREDWIRTGRDQHSTFRRAPSSTSRYSLDDYARAQKLGDTEAALLAALRGRKPGEWAPWYSPFPAYEAFLEAYRPKESLGQEAGPWSFLTRPAKPA